MPDPLVAGLSSWEDLWSQHPAPWRLYIKQFLAAAVDRPEAFQACAVAVFGDEAGEESDQELLCVDCLETFPSKLSLSGHRIHKHGVRVAARMYVAGPVCPHCGDDFRSRLRCLRHMRRCRACAAAMRAGLLPVLDEEVVQAADLADRDERRVAVRAGISVLSGLPFVPCLGRPDGHLPLAGS